MVREDVAAAWGWAAPDAEIAPLTGGLINATYAVRRGGAPIAVLQRLHPIFAGAVNLDIDAITSHLAADPHARRSRLARPRRRVAGVELGRRRDRAHGDRSGVGRGRRRAGRG